MTPEHQCPARQRSGDLMARRIRMPVGIFEGTDLATLVRFGHVEIFVCGIENQIGISRGNVYASRWIDGAERLEPYLGIVTPDHSTPLASVNRFDHDASILERASDVAVEKSVAIFGSGLAS